MSVGGRVWATLGCLILLATTACGGPSDTVPTGPVLTVSPTAGAPGGTVVLLGAPTEVQVGDAFEVAVSVADVEDLYGAELHLHFDPARLQVVDRRGDPADRVEDGDLLTVRFTAQNVVDQAEGRVDYAVSQMPPSKGVSGDGALIRIRFRALKSGAAAVTLDEVLLASSRGEAIPWAADAMVVTIDIR